jgi:hypothetical protein
MAQTSKVAIANIGSATTDGAVITGVANKCLRIVSAFVVTGGTATNVTFNTKPAGSGTAISQLIACAANGGLVLPYNFDGWFTTNVGDGLTVTTSSGSTTGINVTYLEI